MFYMNIEPMQWTLVHVVVDNSIQSYMYIHVDHLKRNIESPFTFGLDFKSERHANKHNDNQTEPLQSIFSNRTILSVINY